MVNQTPPQPIKLARTPYTAEQIRNATHVGRTYEWRVESAGKPSVRRIIQFVEVNEQSAKTVARVLDEKGRELERGQPQAVTWDELRKHAEFPEAQVTIAEQSVQVPAGKFDCWVYTVSEGTGPEASTSRFFFAKNLPGAPVLFHTDKAGQRVMTSTLIAHKPGG